MWKILYVTAKSCPDIFLKTGVNIMKEKKTPARKPEPQPTDCEMRGKCRVIRIKNVAQRDALINQGIRIG